MGKMSVEQRGLVEAEERLVTECLNDAGLTATSVYDLVNTNELLPRAAGEALLRLLPNIRTRNVREGVVRALGCPEARDYALHPLVESLEDLAAQGEESPIVLWTIANSIAAMADESDFSTMVRLVRDSRLGDAREVIALWFGSVRTLELRGRAEGVLIDALRERVVPGHVLEALRRVGTGKALGLIRGFETDANPLFRKMAKRAAATIVRREMRGGP